MGYTEAQVHAVTLKLFLAGHDTQTIPYQIWVNALTGSILSSLLLSRAAYEYQQHGYQPFAMYSARSKHGRSWEDVLGFGRSELEGARARIATEVADADGRGVLFADDTPRWTPDGLLDNSRSLVAYWVAGTQKTTWYAVNQTLLARAIFVCQAKSAEFTGELVSMLTALQPSLPGMEVPDVLSATKRQPRVRHRQPRETTEAELDEAAPLKPHQIVWTWLQQKQPLLPSGDPAPISDVPAQRAAIRRMLDQGFTVEQIQACYTALEADPFWSRGANVLRMTTVASRIAVWASRNRSAEPTQTFISMKSLTPE